MKCKWCNSEIQGNAKFCTNCGGSLIESKPQQEINSINNVENEEKANVALVILSYIIPLAGLIIFLCNKDTKKKTAKASGIAALISVSITTLITIISITMMIITVRNQMIPTINNVKDKIETEIQEQIDNGALDEFKNQVEENIDNIIVNSKWKNYEFTVNGKIIKLPCTYSELSTATSATMKSSDAKSYISPGYYSLSNLYKDEKLALYIEVLNDTTIDQLYTDSKITRVSQTKYQKSLGATELIFPGNLKVGQEITKENIIELLGNPSNISNYTSDGYVKDTYSYYEDSNYRTTNYYEISVVNGIIDELTLDHRRYN